ncbi:hypothetical protein ACJMK2_008009 [Sinanodonta woodiana]|uniref:Uncharacterized protein n=1 Tax=Sinanodonta woodiana TaxID=1069815 RepID=A0ABD3VN87_SINWO
MNHLNKYLDENRDSINSPNGQRTMLESTDSLVDPMYSYQEKVPLLSGIHSMHKMEPKPRFTGHVRNITLVLLNVVFNVAMNVTLPIYAGTMGQVGGDSFVLLLESCVWFVVIFTLMTLGIKYTIDPSATLRPTATYKILFLMGFLTTLNGVFVVFASDPNRTPPYLQGILMTTSIPFTVVCRFIILRKGISLSRLICACAVMAGLFITVEPQIWGLDGSSDNTETKSIAYRILWPLCFAMGFLPYGIMNVICEKELKKGESHSFSFITWTQIFQVVTMVMMFWADFIPQFGMASSPQNFIERLKNGIHCSYSSEAACGGLAWEAWLFYICYCLGNLFNFLLIQYAEGAVYAAVVQAVVSPIAALFWSLFVFDEENLLFFWKPTFNETTAYTIGGLCLMVPAVVLYNYFSYSEEKPKTDTESLL